MQIYRITNSDPQITQISQINSKLKNQDTRSENSSFLNFEFLILNSRKAGFTLIELVIVIFIISLTMALVMPSFWDKGDRDLKSEAKRISSTLRYIYDEAAGKKLVYTVKFDLDNNSYAFESEKESRSFQMGKQVMFKDVIVPSHGEITAGEIAVEFGPLGPEEPLTVHLIKDKYEYTVTFNHLNGRTKIFEGYVQ